MQARRGQWVQIHKILLDGGNRAPSVPQDTAELPFEMRLKGFLQEESADCGEVVTVKTVTGRLVQGTLEGILPKHTHDFGEHICELFEAGDELSAWLAGGSGNE